MSTLPHLTHATWVRSTFSGNGGDNCVEWSPEVAAASSLVPVRDSKDPHGPALVFGVDAFSAFVQAVKAGEFSAV
jgi:hypothetical protein